MPRISILISSLLLALFFSLFHAAPALARSNVTDWYLKDFKTDIQVNKDSSLDVTERILADCGSATGKHGIFRVLATRYKTKTGDFILPTELISISDENNQPLKYSISKAGDTVTYKIGDPNKEVQGENFYVIKYRVKNSIRTESVNFDEFYWNVLGNYWDLEIDKFTVDIHFPSEINKDNSSLNYYTGTIGSKETELATYEWLNNNTLAFASTRTAKAREGLTVSLTFPKNIIAPYHLTFSDKYGFSFLAMMLSIILSLLFIIFSFIISLRLWKKYGRDPRVKKTITPEFEIPENLSPLEMSGIIKRGGLHQNALTATIIRLGVLGYLKIEKVEKAVLFVNTSTYKITRTAKDLGSDLYAVESYILGRVFLDTKTEVFLKDLRENFQGELNKISQFILTDLDKRALVSKKGRKLKIKMLSLGGIILATGCTLFIVPGIFISGLIVLSFGFLMERRTLAGAELNWRVKGFKLYMETAEKYRSRWQEQTNQLEKLLPYAILFGITSEWLKKMKDIYGEKYLANYHPAFMAGALVISDFSDFASAINDISSDINSAVAPSPSGGGGGGFSGGGGGGGGGGGW